MTRGSVESASESISGDIKTTGLNFSVVLNQLTLHPLMKHFLTVVRCVFVHSECTVIIVPDVTK